MKAAFILIVAVSAGLLLLGGCERNAAPLVVYAGNGLKYPLEEIRLNFEKKEGIPVSVVYAGSDSLLATLQKTRKGDIFIPGSASYIKDAGALVVSDQYVALHVPTFVVRKGTLTSYADLLAPGIRIAVGNKDMAAIGRIVEAILKDAPPEQSFAQNIVVAGSTVNELLHLVADGEVDAAVVWTDMLQWEEAKGLVEVKIPATINKPKEIHVCTLATSLAPDRADRFSSYVASAEGRAIFEKYGFGKK